MGLKQDLAAVRETVGTVLHNANTILADYGLPMAGTFAELSPLIRDMYGMGYTAGNDAGVEIGQEIGYAAGEAAGMDRGVEIGEQMAYDAFWDAYQASGEELINYSAAFSGMRWSDVTYAPKYPILAINANNLFSYSRVTDTKVTIDCSQCGSNGATMFSNSKLKTIRRWIVNEQMKMDTQLTNCTQLENLTVEGIIGRSFNAQWCPLTRASIESVIAALSDTVTEQTATFNAAAVAAFTDAEWAALIATKPNWTVEVV